MRYLVIAESPGAQEATNRLVTASLHTHHVNRIIRSHDGAMSRLPPGALLINPDGQLETLDVLRTAREAIARTGSPHHVIVARIGEIAVAESAGFRHPSAPPPPMTPLARIALIARSGA